MENLQPSDALFNNLFGWGFVIVTVLLFLIFIVVLRSLLEYKNAKVVSAKVISVTNIGELNLPTLEYQSGGETLTFRTKTPLDNLVVGQSVDVQIGRSDMPRIFNKNQPDTVPKIMFAVTALLAFFVAKSISFLLTFFGS